MEGIFDSLIPEIQHALKKEGYATPTPVQAQAIPPQVDGRDLCGSAQTGTGKTAAFTIPLLQELAAEKSSPEGRRPRALAPDRRRHRYRRSPAQEVSLTRCRRVVPRWSRRGSPAGCSCRTCRTC